MPLPPPPILDNDALGVLLDAFLSPYEPGLPDVAVKARLSIMELMAWLANPDTIELLDNLTIALQARSKLLAAQALPHAIFGLADTAQYHHPRDPNASASVRARQLETARRASSRIIDLYQFESRRCEGPTPRKPSRRRTPHHIAPDAANCSIACDESSSQAAVAAPSSIVANHPIQPPSTSTTPHPTSPPAAENSDPTPPTAKPPSSKYESPSVSTHFSAPSAVPSSHQHAWTPTHPSTSKSPASRAPP